MPRSPLSMKSRENHIIKFHFIDIKIIFWMV